jgi:hypothetical protein
MNMERDNIIQGRDVLTQYRQAHELLHQESLDPAQMAKRHEILETALRTSFEELGFTSAEEFYTQEEELGQVEYDESLRAMQLPVGDLMRFVDLTGFGLPDQFKIVKDQRALRAADQIPDTVYVGGVFGAANPILTYSADNPTTEVIQRAEAAGLELVSIPSKQLNTAYLYQDDLTIKIITAGRFADKEEARLAAYTVCARALESLGLLVSVPLGRNNIKADGRKLASAGAYQADGVCVTSLVVNLGFDAAGAATLLAEPEIGLRATSIREALGRAVTPEAARAAVHTAVEHVFNGAAVTTVLSARELSVLG